MPGADDTLNAGGPQVDPLDELCTCGHTRGEHHTLDEDCTVIDPECECSAFQLATPEFGNSPPSEAQLQARLDAQHAGIAENVRELTADLPGGEGRIGEIKDELDQILDAAQLCSDTSCGHRRDVHIGKLGDGCNSPGCECPTFLEPKPTRNNTHEAIDTLRREAGVLPRRPGIREQAAALREEDERKRREEQVDRLANPSTALVTHDDLARTMDAEPLSPVAGMDADQRKASDRVQREALDRLCECGHRYGDHWAVDNQCALRNCACVNWTDPRRTEAGGAFEASRPLDLDAVRRAAREPAGVQVGNLGALRTTRCAGCGHEKDDHDLGERHPCVLDGCGCQAFIEYTSPGLDPRRTVVPPLLRKRYIGEGEARALIGDLPVLEELPEVDRVTTYYDAEHWHEVERLARFPQGSSEAEVSDRTITAIAHCLVDLRQSLGVTCSHSEQLVGVLEKNAEAIAKTTEVLDVIVKRLGLIPDDLGKD